MDAIEASNFVEPKINEQLRPDTVLWRYLDAAGLFDFFENSTLFFCRADQFSAAMWALHGKSECAMP